MAFTDIQNKVGQTQMANQILLAQRKIPPPNEGEGTRDYRKRISGGSYKNKPNKNNPFAGMSDEEQRAEALKRQEALNKKRAEEKLDQDPELNKQREDMRQGDYLEDPENPLSDLMKIGGAAAGFGGNLLRMLINPLGGNALASTPQDGRAPTRLFYNAPYDKPKMFIKDEQSIKDAKERFKSNTGIDLAGVPNFPGGGYGSTSGAFVDLSGEAYFLIDGELIPQGGYDPAKHGDLIPHGGPDIPQAMNNTNNSMKIYG